jgi:hypothetical protein
MEQATAGNPKSSEPLIKRVFGLAKAGTDPRTEFVAGPSFGVERVCNAL